jgi:hypothetical protein
LAGFLFVAIFDSGFCARHFLDDTLEHIAVFIRAKLPSEYRPMDDATPTCRRSLTAQGRSFQRRERSPTPPMVAAHVSRLFAPLCAPAPKRETMIGSR